MEFINAKASSQRYVGRILAQKKLRYFHYNFNNNKIDD